MHLNNCVVVPLSFIVVLPSSLSVPREPLSNLQNVQFSYLTWLENSFISEVVFCFENVVKSVATWVQLKAHLILPADLNGHWKKQCKNQMSLL